MRAEPLPVRLRARLRDGASIYFSRRRGGSVRRPVSAGAVAGRSVIAGVSDTLLFAAAPAVGAALRLRAGRKGGASLVPIFFGPRLLRPRPVGHPTAEEFGFFAHPWQPNLAVGRGRLRSRCRPGRTPPLRRQRRLKGASDYRAFFSLRAFCRRAIEGCMCARARARRPPFPLQVVFLAVLDDAVGHCGVWTLLLRRISPPSPGIPPPHPSASAPPSSTPEPTRAMATPKNKREVESGPMEKIRSRRKTVHRDELQDNRLTGRRWFFSCPLIGESVFRWRCDRRFFLSGEREFKKLPLKYIYWQFLSINQKALQWLGCYGGRRVE